MAKREIELPNSYLDELKTLYSGEEAGSLEFDKSILTLAAGALGLSITFVKDIAAKPLPIADWSLALSWLFLILSVLATLLSFQMSQLAFRRQREILNMIVTGQVTDGVIEKNTPA